MRLRAEVNSISRLEILRELKLEHITYNITKWKITDSVRWWFINFMPLGLRFVRDFLIVIEPLKHFVRDPSTNR